MLKTWQLRLWLVLAAICTPGTVILAQGQTDMALAETAPLADALWQGLLTLRLEGPLHGQHLENRMSDTGVPVGFLKEKAKMRMAVVLEMRFLVNALGEFTLSGRYREDGETVLDKEYWYQFEEEHQTEETRVISQRMVRVSEQTRYLYRYEKDDTFDHESLDFGTLRMQPSGRLDKRGQLRVVGSFEPVLVGKGSQTVIKERQPPSEDWNRKESVAEIRRELPVSIAFTGELELRKKPVSGPVQVTFEMGNPLTMPGAERGPSVFRNEVKASGNLSLTPLFGKKR